MECVMVCVSRIQKVTFRPYLTHVEKRFCSDPRTKSPPIWTTDGTWKKKGSLEVVVSPYRYKGRNLLGGVVCDARYAFFHACP